MARTDSGTHSPDSLLTISAALQAIAGRLSRTAEAMKDKGVTCLAVKNQSGLKTGLSSLRSFGMATEEAFEEWIFDQNVFKQSEPESQPSRPRPENATRRPKKQDSKSEAETD